MAVVRIIVLKGDTLRVIILRVPARWALGLGF